MNELLSPCAFVTETAVLTKRGDLFSVLRVRGVDAECLEPDTLDDICRRFEGTLRILGPEYRVMQYIVKRDSPPLPLSTSTDTLARARSSWLQSHATQLFSISLYLVVLRMRPPQEQAKLAFLSYFSTRQTLSASRQELSRDADQLAAAIDSLTIQLSGTIRPEQLDQRSTVRFLQSLVNLSPSKSEPFGEIPKFHLDQHLSQSGIECWPRHLKKDQYFIKMLSLVDPPSRTFPHLLRGLLAVPCNMIVCSEWKRELNQTARREIDKKRRHYHLAKSSMLSYLGNSNPRPDEILIDDSKTAVVEELNNALREMEVNENCFGRLSVTVELFDESEQRLRTATAKTIEIFATHDARVVEETYNMLNAWASMIPGNYAFNLRPMWVMNQTYADLSFLFKPTEGETTNPHLRAPALGVLETRDSTPYFLNLHVQDVGHTVILGSTGSGKSFLMNYLVSSFQQYDPYTVIFDLGGAYRRLTSQYRGSYLHVGKESAFTINPFSLAPTAENLEFLFSFVRVLIERGNATMTPEDRKDLHRAIADLYALDEDVRTLRTLAQTCRRTYGRRLDEWVGEGRLASYFDHVTDNLTLSRFQAFDFEGMDKPEVLEPLLFYILHRANANIYDPDQADTPKLVVFDEAWRFFKNPITREYIHSALKTWRKRNGTMILATQSGDDLARSELLPTISESCMTRFFLANPGMDSDMYREAFSLNSTEALLISRLVPKQQFLLKQPDGAKVLNLFTDQLSYRVFANKED